MSCSVIHQNIRSILEEDSLAYTTLIETGGVPNMDYAGYCCHVSLNRLRQSMERPDLRERELEGLLRRASRKYTLDDPCKNWSYIMARFLTRHANAN